MTSSTGLLTERICVITGATSGIGAVTARELARLGATVIVVGRHAERCARQVARIESEIPGARAQALVADLSSQAEIRRLARSLAGHYGRLDVLVNNAGAFLRGRRQVSVDGVEMTFALNHLSYFMLTLLVMELLTRSPSARVVNVSSVAHERQRLDLEDPQERKSYDGFRAYGRSKLANLLFTYELARRLAGTRVTANALHPGAVASNLGGNNGWINGWLRAKVRNVKNLMNGRMVTPERGARTSIYLASSPEVEGVSGRYFQDCRELRSSQASYDEATARSLWRISEDLTGVRWDRQFDTRSA